MALDRTRALKLECIPEGGSQTDMGPTEVDPKQDAMDAAGYFVQSPTGPAGGDTLVLYGRTGNQAQTTDNTGSATLAQQVTTGGATGGQAHAGLRDLSHFLGAPAEGFASGATQVFNYSATTGMLASMYWYASSAQTIPIYSEVYTYSGAAPGSAVCTTYDASGNAVAKVTETYTVTGGLVTQIMRTR